MLARIVLPHNLLMRLSILRGLCPGGICVRSKERLPIKGGRGFSLSVIDEISVAGSGGKNLILRISKKIKKTIKSSQIVPIFIT